MGHVDFDDREKIDRICDRFEAEWKAGSRPVIRDFLDQSVRDQKELFRELFSIELEYLQSSGQSIATQSYLDAYGEFEESIGSVFQSQGNDQRDTVSLLGEMIPTPSVDAVLSEAERLAERMPSRLGRYRLIRPIGKGGFGNVFLAWDKRLERQVAIKIVRDEYRGDDRAAGLFLREARTIAELEHPNIINVYDAGRTDEGDVYFVMRYCQNGDLRSLLANGEKSHQELSEQFAELAEGLAFAHARGVIHQDIKPSNILIDDNGRFCLVDFGLASRHDPGDREQVVGTPEYMSPEQWNREISVDSRSDVFSLGIVLFEAFEGSLCLPLCLRLKPHPLEKLDRTGQCKHPWNFPFFC
ncbi:MAG: serine/threonine-protein kinase [Planctomycetota bacterium]